MITAEDIRFYADEIATMLNACEDLQTGDNSHYTKEMAKISTYDDIVALVYSDDE